MAQQELCFGVMWQRVMASPLRVRQHYGHPDLVYWAWLGTRGGTAKASAHINVSEDVFAGYAVALRGGESGHIEFMQVGKGRDVGTLQIETFEAKISAGTAISLTTRDAFRVAAAMDGARSLSFWHSAGGFYISQVLVVAAYVLQCYYAAALALSGADAAALASNSVFIGLSSSSANALQWFVQLGLLSTVPLAALLAVQHGCGGAVQRLARMLASLAPIFYMIEISTKVFSGRGESGLRLPHARARSDAPSVPHTPPFTPSRAPPSACPSTPRGGRAGLLL
jgi:callose synthase